MKGIIKKMPSRHIETDCNKWKRELGHCREEKESKTQMFWVVVKSKVWFKHGGLSRE